MFTIKHIVGLDEHLYLADHVEYHADGKRVDAMNNGSGPELYSGRVAVQNPAGITIAAYDLNQ